LPPRLSSPITLITSSLDHRLYERFIGTSDKNLAQPSGFVNTGLPA
jgi:hypothetical protein